MLIGEVVTKSGLTKDTIRFYEKQGLVAPERGNSPYNTYKNYSEGNLNRLLLIKKIKAFGFTLNETADLLDLVDVNQASCKVVSEQVNEKIGDIDRKIAELQALKNTLSLLVNDCCQSENQIENCPSIANV